MKIMDGNKIAQRKFLQIGEKIRDKKISLSLGVVQVGDNPVSSLYVRKKEEAARKIGVEVFVYRFPEHVSEKDLCQKISSLKEDGVIIQLPLPQRLNEQKVLNAVCHRKDVDMLSDVSSGAFYNGTSDIIPPVAGAVKILLNEYKVTVKGANTVVVGCGKLVGKPVAVYLMREGATVSVVNRSTKNISWFTRNADIIVSGAGSSSIIKGDMIKEGAVVIDAGSSSEDGSVRGDVDRESVEKKALLLSPVPGGVGPLTVYCLLANLICLYEH